MKDYFTKSLPFKIPLKVRIKCFISRVKLRLLGINPDDYKRLNELEVDRFSPCDDCELNYINQCSSCKFASPLINDSLNYKDDED